MAKRPFKFNLNSATTPVELEKKQPNKQPQQKPVEPAPAKPAPPAKQEPQEESKLADPTTDVNALAKKAAKTVSYDEQETYIGVVSDIIAKGGGKSIFKIDGPHGQVQAYSNAIRAPFRSKMHVGASVEFAPIENPGTGGVTFFTAQITGIRASDPRVEILNDIQELYAGTVQTHEYETVLAAINPKESLDNNIAAISGKFKGEFIGCTSTGIFCFTQE